jgi:molybdopterin-synthase adenylyltransferase
VNCDALGLWSLRSPFGYRVLRVVQRAEWPRAEGETMVGQLPTVAPRWERYRRQIGISGLGETGQLSLSTSSVGISRVGGVGGNVASHLARAGIGRLKLAHGGTIEEEALNRWPLVFTDDVGRPSTEVHSDTLGRINPTVQVAAINNNITDPDSAAFLENVDVLVDGAPLFEERYELNRLAVLEGKPLVSGAMYDTECVVTSINPGRTPCFQCIYPEKPPNWDSIYVFPAISPGPALVAAVMAMEVIKILTGSGEPLYGKLFYFDMNDNSSQIFSVHRDENCPACGNL